jgi:16S rRNA (cytosine967-C5)-methyltransferase
MKVSPARKAAFEILNRMESTRAFSSVLLPEYEEKLSPNDRGLCHELVLGVLRRQIYLDRVIDQFTGAKRLDDAVRSALRLGAYQLRFLEKIPDYSAINESVNLVQTAKKTSAKGLVNAVLRRISERATQFAFADEIERVSVETSHPRWLVEKWISDFGFETAEQIAGANNEIPMTAFRLTARGATPPVAWEKSSIVEGAYITRSIDPELRELADLGEIYFQDEASQLVARVAAAGMGNRFLDVCAAPGGKTTLVAAVLESKGKLLVAGDVHTSRAKLLKATCDRQGAGSVNVVQYDAETDLPFADGSFDTVLVDAPCSGTGTIRHNPEIRYFLDADDFADLANKQRRILNNASKLVRPGGRLIYSTCSIQTEENEVVCHEFLKATEEFEKVRPDVPDALLTGDDFARTFPHRDGTDGFFIAEFRRRNR